MSAYKTVSEAIERVMPAGWRFVGYEPVVDIPDVTSVTLKLRELSRISQGAWRIKWIITITASSPSRETADPSLFDDMFEFASTLATHPDLTWLLVEWPITKTVGDDLERLAYDISITTEGNS